MILLIVEMYAENTGCKEARLLKRLRTEKSDAEDCPPSQASKLDTSSCPVQAQTSEQEVSVAPPATVLKQEPPIDPHPPTAEQQPTAAPPAHASKQEPAAVPCAVPSQSENEPAINRDTPQPPCNRVLLEPNLLYVLIPVNSLPKFILARRFTCNMMFTDACGYVYSTQCASNYAGYSSTWSFCEVSTHSTCCRLSTLCCCFRGMNRMHACSPSTHHCSQLFFQLFMRSMWLWTAAFCDVNPVALAPSHTLPSSLLQLQAALTHWLGEKAQTRPILAAHRRQGMQRGRKSVLTRPPRRPGKHSLPLQQPLSCTI